MGPVIDAFRSLVLIRCRICWRITLVVFLSILVIEGALLVPSYQRYETDRLRDRERAARAALDAALQAARSRQGPEWAALDAIIGVAGIQEAEILKVGEEPERLLSDTRGLDGFAVSVRSDTGQTLRLSAPIGQRWIALTVDVADVSGQLRAFVLRILGLVAVISVVVTGATMTVLRFFVFGDIVRLGQAAAAAARSPADAERQQVRSGRADELGDLIRGFNALLARVSSSIRELSLREGQVRELAETLEGRVIARTAELAAAKDAAEQASRAKSDFLANMSHELRTPLNAVLGFSEMIHARTFGPLGHEKYGEYIADIHRSGIHLLSIIDDLLDMARIEAGRLALNEEEFPAAAAVAEAVAIARGRSAELGVAIAEPDIDGDILLRADRRLVRQALLNLLSNAMKFSAGGAEVRLAAYLPKHGGLVLEVRDSGVGMRAGDIQRAMSPFGQVANVMSRRHQGVGLGLPLTRRFVELHGGDLSLESEPGRGTRARLSLPPTRVLLRDAARKGGKPAEAA